MGQSVPLVVFDFDHTLLDCNTDMEVQKLSPGGQLPDNLKQRRSADEIDWTEFMQEVFHYLHASKVTKEQITSFMRNLPFMSGVSNMMETLEKVSAEIIIISDSNSVFISELLDAANLTKYVQKVFTNPAFFNEDGKLMVKPCMHQTECNLSRPNLCKGKVLDDYIKSRNDEGQHFSMVAYAGDGANDFCPMMRLPEGNGLAFPRKHYAIIKHIAKHEKNDLKIKASIIKEWNTLSDITETILNFHNSKKL